MKIKNNTKILSRLIDESYGKKGTPKRNKFEKKYQNFKLCLMIQEPKIEQAQKKCKK
jgi:HTH-type transcriptional regulator/antitoxin HipB